MDISHPHRSALWRLVVAMILLGVILGSIDWWVEIERIDTKVLSLAASQSTLFAKDHLQDSSAFSQNDVQIKTYILKYFKDTFPIVELYDAAKHKAFEYVAPGRETLEDVLEQHAHVFPVDNNPIYKRFEYDHHLYVQVFMPLQKDSKVYGYFEGIYDVPNEVENNIHENVIRSVIMVWITVIVSGLSLYPLLMSLNRNFVQASKNVLRGNIELLEVLGGAIAQRDSDTNAHNYRVTWYALKLAEKVKMPTKDIQCLIVGAFLHDVGKIGVADSILLKPGKLTEDEFQSMKQHVTLGRAIISKAKWLGDAKDIVEYHHEKWDGSGYIKGLSREEIPLSARIFAIVDVFDALTSKRPYKEPMSLADALAIVNKDAGGHFDPSIVTAFNEIASKEYKTVISYTDTQLQQILLTTIEGYYGLCSVPA